MCVVKLGLMKAYDHVEWLFLEAMLRKIGFPVRMMQLIMSCVTSVRFSVKVNGELLPQFSPTRGILQGDPMSPYHFQLGQIDRGIRVVIGHHGSHTYYSLMIVSFSSMQR